MKKHITFSTLFLSLLALIVVGCGDNSTNSPKMKEKYKDPLAGTGWKFIAFVDGETGKMENPFFENLDFNNLGEEYLGKYNFTIFFSKQNDLYKIYENPDGKVEINIVGVGYITPIKEGVYEVQPNTNIFEKIGLAAHFGGATMPDAKYDAAFHKRKSFRLNADTLKLYSTLDSTGSYMLYLKSNLPVPRDTNKADNP